MFLEPPFEKKPENKALYGLVGVDILVGTPPIEMGEVSKNKLIFIVPLGFTKQNFKNRGEGTYGKCLTIFKIRFANQANM